MANWAQIFLKKERKEKNNKKGEGEKERRRRRERGRRGTKKENSLAAISTKWPLMQIALQ